MEISKKSKIEFAKDDFLLKNICVVSMGFMTGLLFFEFYRKVLSSLNQAIEKSDLLPYSCLVVVVIVSSLIYNLILVRLNIIQYINKCNKIVYYYWWIYYYRYVSLIIIFIYDGT